MDLTLHRLIEYAIHAPSGENAQPWRFVSNKSNEIEVYVEVSRDQSPYSWGHRAAYVAIGAALENMKIGSSILNKKLSIELFPESLNTEFVARIVVTDSEEPHQDPLAEAIEKRITNRKPYKKYQLSDVEIKALQDSLLGQMPRLSLTTKQEDLEAVAQASSTNERIILGNVALHDYFFSHVNWTEEQDFTRKEGFFIKSLELPPPAVLGFRAMSSWGRANTLNRYLHFNEMVQAQNAKLYEGSSGMGAISTDADSPRDAVLAGMAIERVWLTATSLGLAFQPLAGIPYLALGVRNNYLDIFSDSEREHINASYATLQKTFNLGDRQVYFAFRVGKADPPSAKARRYTVEDVSTSNT